MTRCLVAIITAILLSPRAEAAFVTINFDALTIYDALDDHRVGPVYTSQGYTLTATADPSFN